MAGQQPAPTGSSPPVSSAVAAASHPAGAWETGRALTPIDLPPAPPVRRAVGRPYRRPRAPAWALVALGAALIVGPVAGGLFSKTAAAKQMIDRFAPHMQPAALARYASDLTVLRRGAAAVQSVYADQAVPAGAFPGLDAYRRQSGAIDRRAQDLLGRIVAAEPDYQRVAGIGGFDRLPFLLVFGGIVAVYGGTVLLAGRRGRGRGAAALVVLASAGLVAYPFLGGLRGGAGAGQRMLRSFAPVMTTGEVRQLQDDFVVLVTAEGELDTGFRGVPRPGPAADAITALDRGWAGISSDLASLVGVINDDIGDYGALKALNDLPHRVGLPGFAAYSWMLVGIGCAGAGLSAAAWPRRSREAA